MIAKKCLLRCTQQEISNIPILVLLSFHLKYLEFNLSANPVKKFCGTFFIDRKGIILRL